MRTTKLVVYLATASVINGTSVALTDNQSSSPDERVPATRISTHSVHLPIPFHGAQKIPPEAHPLRPQPRLHPPDELRQAVERLGADQSQRDRILADYTRWWITQFAADLPAAKKKQLEEEYMLFFGRATRITRAVHPPGAGDRRRAEYQQKLLATYWVDLALAEREILRDFPHAQELRYGHRVKYESALPARAYIEEQVGRFFTGSYLGERSARLTARRDGAVYVPEPTRRDGTFRLRLTTPSTTFAAGMSAWLTTCTDTSEREFATPVERSAVDWVAYAFVGAKSELPDEWEEAGLPGIYHTSILGGRWYLEKAVGTYTYVKCSAPGATPLQTTVTRTTYTWRFYDWVVANGCGGEYLNPDDGDTLTLFAAFSPSDPSVDPAEDVERQLLGSTEDANGKECRARYGAYPQGAYGLNWVCHQACNAFTTVKWELAPVYYPISDALYGYIGSAGLSDVVDPCKCPLAPWGASHCAVAGHPAACWGTAYLVAPAWGNNLFSGFHPEKGWLNTECQYNEEPIGLHVPGWDFPPITTSVP